MTLFVAMYLLLPLSPATHAQLVTININRTKPLPLAPGFSGFNVVGSNTPADFADTSFRKVVSALKPGVLRWPGGTVDDAFNWKTGSIEVLDPNLTNPPWTMIDLLNAHFQQFPDKNFNAQIKNFTNTAGPILTAKGGHPLGDQTSGYAGFAKAVGAQKLMIVVNAVSDTVQSAQELAFYAAKNNLPVAGFELVNEPFYLILPDARVGPLPGAGQRGKMPDVPGTFLSGLDYATKMKPYRDAIKHGYTAAGHRAEEAMVAIAGGYATVNDAMNTQWREGLDTYASKNGAYWDAVVMHYYPVKSPGQTFAEAMVYANDALAQGTDRYVAQYKTLPANRGKPLFVTEYDVTFNDKAMNGSVYGGLFAAEYVMRMSAQPVTLNVLMHELTNEINAVAAPADALSGSSNWSATLKDMGAHHRSMNTKGLVKGLYMNAQVLAVELANHAVNISDQTYSTSMGGLLGTVSTRSAPFPALHAQAYHGTDGTLQILVTNKAATAKTLKIQVDESPDIRPFKYESMGPSAGDPAERNSATVQNVKIKSGATQGTITVPGYTVMRLWQPL